MRRIGFAVVRALRLTLEAPVGAAQQMGKVPRIGVLFTNPPVSEAIRVEAFQQGMNAVTLRARTSSLNLSGPSRVATSHACSPSFPDRSHHVAA
jgi:hypothetical protein